MTPHVDILEQPESLRKPLVGSVALHVAAFGTLLLTAVIQSGHHEIWGEANSGGPGSMAINVVSKIPMPAHTGVVNPLANDTHSAVPTPPPAAKPQRRAPAEDLDAVPINTHAKPKPADVARSAPNNWRAKQQDRPNQLYSTSGQELVSNMVGQIGSGGVGVGRGSPLGTRFGGYVTLLEQRVAQKWNTGDVDSRIRTAPVVIVAFELMRDGSVRDVRIEQRSGIPALDYSAQRAIYDAAPFPPLPAGYDRNSASVEFEFDLRR